MKDIKDLESNPLISENGGEKSAWGSNDCANSWLMKHSGPDLNAFHIRVHDEKPAASDRQAMFCSGLPKRVKIILILS